MRWINMTNYKYMRIISEQLMEVDIQYEVYLYLHHRQLLFIYFSEMKW